MLLERMCIPAIAQTLSTKYTITDLGVSPGGNGSYATGINNAGMVIGNSIGNNYRTFLWSSATGMQGLDSGMEAYGINDAGQVVGDIVGNHASLWRSPTDVQDLGTLLSDDVSVTYGINNVGQVVGVSSGFGSGAFLWSSATGMQNLGTLPGGNGSSASGINDVGQVVGTSYSNSAPNHAFLWDSKTGMQDLGTSGDYSAATCINNVGQVAGDSYGSKGDHAFLWSSTTGMQDLGTLSISSDSMATGINNAGQVVGFSYGNHNGDHAFLWSSTTGMQDLNSLLIERSSWVLSEATAINDSGQIVGYGYHNGQNRAFLLTPSPLAVLDANSQYTHVDLSDRALGSVSPSDPNFSDANLQNVARTGAVTDGVTKLLLRYTADEPGVVSFSFQDLSGHSSTDTKEKLTNINGGSSQSVPTHLVNGQNIALALYTVPLELDSDVRKGSVQFTASFLGTSSSTQQTSTQSITLERPPVVLIHGVWSDSGTWKGAGPLAKLQAAGLDPYGAYLVDYGFANAGHFPLDTKYLRLEIDKVVNDFRSHGIATTQVDVVGHSMGGLITRTFAAQGGYRQSYNFQKGSIRRIITIGTPHAGSELANLGWYLQTQTKPQTSFMFKTIMRLFNHPVDEGAIEDLRVGSPATQTIPDTPIPSYAILGDLNLVNEGEGDIADSLLEACQLLDLNPPGLDTSSPNSFISSLFNSQATDGVVSGISQRGGLSDAYVHRVYPLFHTGEPSSSEVGDTVANLLMGPQNNFSPIGFPAVNSLHYSAPSGWDQPSQSSAPRQVRAVTTPLVALTSPASGTTLQPGQTFTVTATPINGADIRALLFIVGGDTTTIGSALVKQSPFSATFTVPSDYVGGVTITVFARDAAGNLSQVTGNFSSKTTATVQGLTVEPTSVNFSNKGSNQQLQVTGHFSDNVDREVSAPSTGTTYKSDTPATATVSADGLITAVANGTATITVTNNGQSAQATVTVQFAVPQVAFVSPSRASQDTTATSLTVQGTNLGGASKVEFWLNGAPAPNLTATNIQVDPSGANLTTTVAVGAQAALGARTVVVTTPGGQSDTTANENNTFTVAGADKTSPTVTVKTPTNGTTVSSLPAISGTATDNSGGSGLARIELSLKRNSDGKSWTGSSWGKATALPTTLHDTSWTYGSLPTGSNLRTGTYTATASAFDNAGNNKSATSQFVFDGHSPVAAVTLAPMPAYRGAQLKTTTTKSDADGDAVTLRYVWKRNGAIIAGQNGATLNGKALDLRKGQTVSVEVTPNDGAVNGKTVKAQIRISNSLPIAKVSLTPRSPRANSMLTATVTATDADSDSVKQRFIWKRNGVVLKGKTGSTLDLATIAGIKSGDIIRVEVTPNDGSANGSIAIAQLTVSST